MSEQDLGALKDNLFGMAAVELKLLTCAQVGECMMLQSGRSKRVPLAKICFDEGHVTRQQVDEILEHARKLHRRLNAEAALFGRVAISLGVLSRDQLTAAVAKQRRTATNKKIGELCLELGFLSEEDVDAVLARQVEVKRRIEAEVPLFGKLAIEHGLLTPAQLEECVETQDKGGGVQRIGEVCVKLGFMDKDQVKQILAMQRAAAEGSPHRQPSAPPKASPAEQAPVVRPPLPAPGSEPSMEASQPRQPPAGEPDSAPSMGASLPSELPLPGVSSEPSPDQGALEELASTARENKPSLARYLDDMVSAGASELHLTSGCSPRLRIDGNLRSLAEPPLHEAQLRQLLLELAPDDASIDFDNSQEAEFERQWNEGVRLRCHYFRAQAGSCAVIAWVPQQIMSAELLGLPPAAVALSQQQRGLLLITSPVRNGKSTTLATLVDLINGERDGHIITIEQRIEQQHDHRRCLVNQRQIGVHTASAADGLRAALQASPDVLVIDELADSATTALAIEAADAGHLVIATMRSASALRALDWIVEQYSGAEQTRIRGLLASSLSGIIAQVLCGRLDGGLVAAYEIVTAAPEVASAIREGRIQQLTSLTQADGEGSVQTLNEHLVELVREGFISPAEAFRRSSLERDLERRLAHHGISL